MCFLPQNGVIYMLCRVTPHGCEFWCRATGKIEYANSSGKWAEQKGFLFTQAKKIMGESYSLPKFVVINLTDLNC